MMNDTKMIFCASKSLKKSLKGFTLIEVMIVVLILGILSAFAYPTYTQYVTRANRSDAQEKIAEIMFEQERYQVRRRRYTIDLTDLGYDSATNVLTANGHYRITATECTGGINNCVLLTAAPTPGGRQAVSNEADLSLNSRGVKVGPWKK